MIVTNNIVDALKTANIVVLKKHHKTIYVGSNEVPMKYFQGLNVKKAIMRASKLIIIAK